MTHRYNSHGKPYLVLDSDGYLALYTADGSLVGANIFLRVQDHVDDVPFVIGKFHVNIVSTKDEMIADIENNKNK